MVVISKKSQESSTLNSTCPSCGYRIQYDLPQVAAAATPSASSCVQELVGLPAGVKFDPTDQELLEHLEGKATADTLKLHPLIDQFIPTIQGEDGICYTHPEKLPGVRQDGLVRHFFHRPSRAYTTGTRKRRKVQTDADGSETRWHKTGKTRPVLAGGKLAGYKKILVLYTNYGKQRKPEKTNWIMHQYHLGADEEEKDGELVVSKVFYQTQPRQCSSGGGERGGLLKHVTALQAKHKAVDDVDDDDGDDQEDDNRAELRDGNNVGGEFYMDQSVVAYNQGGQNRVSTTTHHHHLLHGFSMHASGTSFLS